jgi:DNA processing protein
VALANNELTGFETPELLAALEPDALPLAPAELERQERAIEEAEEAGASLVTVLDEGYPTNLCSVYDRPPFLFIRGRLEPGDERAIAVVGTRRASEEGLRQAGLVARGLAERGVTVVSGLAAGIDTAAHMATLDAGGRTVAVMGTGILSVYPRQNAELAERIVQSGGALLSQFWPSSPPTPYRFPMRNRTMSGLALGTVVVEAPERSGARMQARLALEHGRRVFLFSGLVTEEAWAKRVRDHPATTEVSSAEDVLAVVDTLEQRAEQLTLAS